MHPIEDFSRERLRRFPLSDVNNKATHLRKKNIPGGFSKFSSKTGPRHVRKKQGTATPGGHGIDSGVSGSAPVTAFSSTPSPHIKLRAGDIHFSATMVIFLHFLLANIGNVACNPTVYDQRQSGKTNVRVDVKDAVVIAIGDGEFGGDYDYNYDYSDLTVKPIMAVSSTSAPLSSTTPPKSTTVKSTTVLSTSPSSYNITQNAAVVLEAENNSIIFPASGLKPGNGSTSAIKIPPHSYKPDQIPVLVLQETPKPHKFLPVRTVEKQYLSSSQIRGKASNSSSVNPEDLPPRHCSPGFFLDNHNRCKRIRRERPQLPFGLRFDHRPLTRS